MTVSLIISTYNSPKALDLCLMSVLQQSVLPDEVLIADDGSNEETRKIVEELRNNLLYLLYTYGMKIMASA